MTTSNVIRIILDILNVDYFPFSILQAPFPESDNKRIFTHQTHNTPTFCAYTFVHIAISICYTFTFTVRDRDKWKRGDNVSTHSHAHARTLS